VGRPAGLGQLRKYHVYPAQPEGPGILPDRMSRQATAVRQELHRVLVQELWYFSA